MEQEAWSVIPLLLYIWQLEEVRKDGENDALDTIVGLRKLKWKDWSIFPSESTMRALKLVRRILTMELALMVNHEVAHDVES